jgi:hypothetical protein
MFYKEIEPGSWASLHDQGISHIVPISSRGLTSVDSQSFFRKTAASEKFLHELKDVKLATGEIPIHINAIGATEFHGFNRKGDAFAEQTCQNWHHTFVTEGKLYEHHVNHDPKNNFGKVASSCYNDNMHRIELLVIANGNHAAAKKNQGNVVADEFLSRLAKNADVAVSMGCVIKNDVCMVCGNKARTRLDYCDEETCIDPKTGEYGFGCKKGLTKVASNGRTQYVENIDPHFFDISLVTIPADRTAYGMVADYITRSAKTASFEKGADGYLGITRNKNVSAEYRTRISAVLTKLADYERTVMSGVHPDKLLGYGFYGLPSDLSLGEKIASLTAPHRYAGFRHLAQQGILLTPESFAYAIGLDKSAGQMIRNNSRNIYQDTHKKYADFSFDVPALLLHRIESALFSKIAELYLPSGRLSSYQLDPSAVTSAVSRGVFTAMKCAEEIPQPQFRDIAEAYALYKAASLCCFPDHLYDFGIRSAVLQTLSVSDLVQ